MEQREFTFRVFVSSTFSDLVAERNALQESVFPRLREYCQKHGARYQVSNNGSIFHIPFIDRC
jgi:hypothetical protein